MQLDENDIRYLIQQKNAAEAALEASFISKDATGAGRYPMRAEAAVLLLNLAGFRWDNVKRNAYKISQKEEREYFNVSTTNSTTK